MSELFGRLSCPELVEESCEILAKAKERFRPKLTLAMFSGGNDSTTMLRVLHDQVDAAVHIRTGIGIESTFEHVRKVCEDLGVKLIVLQTDPAVYQKIVLDPLGKSPCQGFPGPAMHYVAYNRLKQRQTDRLQAFYTRRGEILLLVSGVRKKESKRRASLTAKEAIELPSDRLNRTAFVKPLINAEGRDMVCLREELEVPQSKATALIHKSGECLCGAFAKPGELEEIEFWFPETGRYIRDLECEAAAAGKPYCKWGHGKIQGPSKPVGIMCQGCQLFPEMFNHE